MSLHRFLHRLQAELLKFSVPGKMALAKLQELFIQMFPWTMMLRKEVSDQSFWMNF